MYVEDIDTNVILSTVELRNGIRRTKGLQYNANYVVTLKTGETIKDPIRINELHPSEPNDNRSYILISAANEKSSSLWKAAAFFIFIVAQYTLSMIP